MNTCRAKPHFAQFWCNISPFRINTCKSVSKQTTLSTFRINTYEKTGGGAIPSYHPILPLPFSVHLPFWNSPLATVSETLALLTNCLLPPGGDPHGIIHIAVGLFTGITLALVAA